MRHLSADYIFINKNKFLKRGILSIDKNNVICDVIDTAGNIKEVENLEYYNGIITPGFVNAHCHLELSYLKGVISRGGGLSEFISEIVRKPTPPHNLSDIIMRADAEMQAEGIVAVGDISNTDSSFEVKQKSPIFYHNFLELFGDTQSKITASIAKAKRIKDNYKKLIINLVPHAPYSCSPKLFEEINKLNSRNEATVISIHNQETEVENDLFNSQNGALHDSFIKRGFDFSSFAFCKKNSLQSILQFLPNDKNILLIHNTFTQDSDIDFAESYSDSIYWTFCPSANLYIENKLPDLDIFFRKAVKTCIGTDSYASNTRLSILHELKLIHQNFPNISLGELLQSACLNGAEALNIASKYGSIEVGKSPGINLIKNIDYKNLQITANSEVEKLA